jgi:sphingomyelin phosphodiesterase
MRILGWLGLPAVWGSVGELVHLTDMHLDLEYAVGAPTACVLGSTGLGCCRSYDIPLPGPPSRPWGEYTCDAPLTLVDSVLAWIANYSAAGSVDAVLYGGDTVGHHDVFQSTAKNVHTLRTVTERFAAHFPNMSVLCNQGNHDTYPIDQTPPWNRQLITDELAAAWQGLLAPAERRPLRRTFYRWRSARSPNLEIVSLHSLAYDTHNLFPSSALKSEQAAWLQSVLADIRRSGRYVYVLGHIPPGGGEASAEYNEWIVPVLANYSDVVRGSMYGHSHKDQLYLYPAHPHAPPAWIAPSVMPDGRDPCFRIYQYDRDRGTLLSYDQYCLDLDGTNRRRSPRLYRHYSSRELYPALTAEALRIWHRAPPPESLVQYCLHYYGIRAGRANEACYHNATLRRALAADMVR